MNSGGKFKVRRKNIPLIMATAACAALIMAGCGKKDTAVQSNDSQIDLPVNTETEKPVYTDDTELSTNVKGGILDEIDGQLFYYSSGAGGWATELKVFSDGSFQGHYYDSDMGDTGADYPNGTQYDCQFRGKFSTPEQVSNYSYAMQVEKIEQEQPTGKEEIIDGIKYVYTEPSGVSEGAKMYIYLPGSKISSLPEGFVSWANMALNGADTLPFYGIYNEKDDAGFVGETSSDSGSSSNVSEGTSSLSSDIQNELSKLEEQDNAINDKLKNESLAQDEMNRLTAQRYKLWDDELNSIWAHLKDTLDDSTMSTLKEEERSWIKDRDSQIEVAGKEAEGGTMQPMLENDTGADITRERVYELAEYYK